MGKKRFALMQDEFDFAKKMMLKKANFGKPESIYNLAGNYFLRSIPGFIIVRRILTVQVFQEAMFLLLLVVVFGFRSEAPCLINYPR